MNRIARILVFSSIAAAGGAYLIFSHLLTIDEDPSLAMLIPGVIPLTIVALLAAWNSRFRWVSLALLAGLATWVVWNLESLRTQVQWLYFAQHAGAMTLLAITFGSTLGRDDSQALCSRVARLMLPEPADPAYMRYTWKVTVVWTIYFVLSGVVSVGLFFLGPIAIWSFFANLLTPLLVGLMFIVEYLVRVRVLPDRAHFSIRQTIEAYRAYERRQEAKH